MTYFIGKEQEKTYFKIPFEVLTEYQKLEITYTYERFRDINGVKTEINIIDLGIEAPESDYIGWSGSDRTTIEICDYNSSSGYKNKEIVSGTWNILIGAYKVSNEGVEVKFDIKLTPKKKVLLFGDTHIHTKGSDGVLSIDEVAQRAKTHKMDYIVITDHNNFAHNFNIQNYDNLTVIAGTELTHYNGHIGLIGVNKPFKDNFMHNTKEELTDMLKYAKEQGAIISLNHPCCPFCGFKWGFDVPFDAIEVWNGIMTEHNIRAIELWNSFLLDGKKISILAGSDFHRPELLYDIGMPCTAVFSKSKQKSDILEAIHRGNSYLTYKKDAPIIDCEYLGEEILKNTVINVRFDALKQGDIVKIVYNGDIEEIKVTKDQYIAKIDADKSGFIRFEVLRKYLSTEHYSIASISNAVYIK